MGRNLFAAVLSTVCLTMLPAQAPPPAPPADDAPLDFAALAQQLDPGALPSITDAIPATHLGRLQELGRRMTPAERELMLCWRAATLGRNGDPLPVFAAAAAVLAEDPPPDASAAALLLPMRAWRAFASFGRSAARLRDASGQDESWLTAAAEPTRRRARSLCARLLREHPEAPAVCDALALLDGLCDDVAPERLHAEVLRRRGAHASRLELLRMGRATLQAGRLDAAASWLGRAAAAPPAALQVERAIAAEGLCALRHDLAAARAALPAPDLTGTAADIARLQFLLVVDPKAATALARHLVDADVPHALPWALAAMGASLHEGPGDPTRLIEHARTLPGLDMRVVAATYLARSLPIFRGRVDTAAQGERVLAELAALRADVDRVGESDPSELARMLGWLRREVDWPQPTLPALQACLPAVVELQQDLPDSLDAYAMQLVAAVLSDDDELAWNTLLRPIPAAFADLHGLALRRAEIFVRRALAADRVPTEAESARVFGDLERIQGDPRDANYLRGVLCWSQACRPGASVDLMRRARELFVAAQRSPAEVGWWGVASALQVADLELQHEVDLDPFVARAPLRGEGERGLGLSMQCVAAMLDGTSPSTIEGLQAAAAQAVAQSAAVLHAALAVGHSERGDVAAARAAAKSALQAIRKAGGGIPHDRGVVATGQWRHGLETSGGIRCYVDVSCDLWVVPRLPSVDRLKLLAADR